MFVSWLSPASLFNSYLRRSFGAAGLSSQTIPIDDQTTIHFWGPKPDSPRANPTKPALVLIHGFGPAALWQWRPQAAALSPHFDLYVPDLVFFGESTTASAERTERFQAACVGKLMERVGVEKYSVAGTSYGGFVAYRMAEMWGERVEKVVVASSGVNMVRGDGEKLLRRAAAETVEEFLLPQTAEQLRVLLGLALFKRPAVLPSFLLTDFIHKLYTENRMEKIELLRDVSFGKDDTPKISPLKQEVLIVWGEHDQIFLLEMATQLKEHMQATGREDTIGSDEEHITHAPS
ncbi:uncharacterized protein LOC131150806 isoform X2 [Malania oleifera]|uniref:uncharacterized protein LOC131150806 isoform X2 n=1 Tax=Malania oleifera TaxID=397392 RepID=UPI0025ADF060|nr:uncharacterized protein LOC131150806 isoform X2 [Malania oleifera]